MLGKQSVPGCRSQIPTVTKAKAPSTYFKAHALELINHRAPSLSHLLFTLSSSSSSSSSSASMAGSFPNFSSPSIEDDAEVDAIISQAIDLCALEQISKLNLAHLQDDDSSLPTELEARFRKLKSFPAAHTKPRCPKTSSFHHPEKPQVEQQEDPDDKQPEILNEADTICSTKSVRAKVIETKLGTGLGSDRESSPSPRKQACCFGFSPKKHPVASSKKKKKGKGDEVGGGFEMDEEFWRVNDDMLEDLGTFSLKEQKRKLKRVVKEQEKASREAEKLVELIKQASARMEVAMVDELLSDEDEKIK